LAKLTKQRVFDKWRRVATDPPRNIEAGLTGQLGSAAKILKQRFLPSKETTIAAGKGDN
jgi:hypothetical protein